MLDNKNKFDRRSAIEALVELKDIHAVEPLFTMLDDAEKDTRLWAISALGTLGDKRAIIPLGPLVNDPEKRIAESAQRVIADLEIDK
jgi:HEAT repeat protein